MFIGFGCDLLLWRDLALYPSEVDIDHSCVSTLLDNSRNNFPYIRRELINNFGILCSAHSAFDFFASDARDQVIKSLWLIHDRAGVNTLFIKEWHLDRDIAGIAIENRATLWLSIW